MKLISRTKFILGIWCFIIGIHLWASSLRYNFNEWWFSILYYIFLFLSIALIGYSFEEEK